VVGRREKAGGILSEANPRLDWENTDETNVRPLHPSMAKLRTVKGTLRGLEVQKKWSEVFVDHIPIDWVGSGWGNQAAGPPGKGKVKSSKTAKNAVKMTIDSAIPQRCHRNMP